PSASNICGKQMFGGCLHPTISSAWYAPLSILTTGGSASLGEWCPILGRLGHASLLYYFRFTSGTHQCSDCDALNLPDDEAARGEAELEGQDLLDSGEGDWGHWTIWVTDEIG